MFVTTYNRDLIPFDDVYYAFPPPPELQLVLREPSTIPSTPENARRPARRAVIPRPRHTPSPALAKVSSTTPQSIPHISTKEIVKKTLLESSISVVILAVNACFITSIAGVVVLSTLLTTQIILQILWRVCSPEVLASPDYDNDKLVQVVKKIHHYICPLLFSVFSYSFLGTLIHEYGHAIASSLLFTNSHPTITLNANGGGLTSYTRSPLSSLGSKIGQSNSIALRSASGCIISVIVALAFMVIGDQIKKRCPEVNRYLSCMATLTIVYHITYALSALYTPVIDPMNTPHDFITLAAYGIHPLVSVVTIVALPLIYTLGHKLYKSVC